MILSVAIAKYRVRFYLHDKILNKNAAFYENESEVPTEFFRIRYEVVEVNEPFEVGDIVDFKTIMREPEWTQEERQEFLISILIVSNLEEVMEGRLAVPIEAIEKGKAYPFNVYFDRLKKRKLKLTDEEKVKRISRPEPVIIKPLPILPKKEIIKKKSKPIISVM